MTHSDIATEWRVRGSYFAACNCEAICPCRSVHGKPGGPSTYGICYGAVSWHIQSGHSGPVDLLTARSCCRCVTATTCSEAPCGRSSRWRDIGRADPTARSL
jgi:hypothetical protein